MKKIILLFISLSASISLLQAQQAGTGGITGTVEEHATGTPVEFATVTLLNLPDSSFAGGAQTGTAGAFDLKGVAPGDYALKVSFIGYGESLRGDIRVKAGKVTTLEAIRLRSNMELLDGVVVEASVPAVEHDLDKTTFNVTEDIQASSSNASEILEKIPMVELDEDGKPSVMGNAGVMVLIDGKPSKIYGTKVETVLKLLPATAIEKIEVITNPSARYASNGGAVLNIITRKNKLVGVSGIANVSVETNNEYSGGLNLNIKRKKFSLNNNISGEYSKERRGRELFRENFPEGEVFYTDQRRRQTEVNHDFSYNGGLFYDFDEKTNLGISFGLGQDNEREDELQDNRTLDSGRELDEMYTRDVTGDSRSWNYRAAIDFDRTLKNEGQVLDLDAYYSSGRYDNDFIYDQQSDLPRLTMLENHFYEGNNRSFTIKADYSHPFGEKQQLEVGLRTDWDRNDNGFIAEAYDEDADGFIRDAQLSNDFAQKEDDYSAYAEYRMNWEWISLRAGGRVERAFQETRQLSKDRTYSNDFLNFIPTLAASAKLKNNDRVRFSYSRRANRPEGDQLNPFVDYSDRQNTEAGNPALRPEFVNSFETGYSKYVKQFSLYSSVFYRHSNNPIQRFRTIDSTGVSFTTWENMGMEKYYGLEMGTGAEILPDWRASLNLSLRKNEIITFDQENESLSFNARFYTFFPLWAGFRGYFFSYYRGPRAIPQGTIKGMLITSLGLRKSFLDDRARFSMRISDLFNERQYNTTLAYTNYIQTSVNHRQTRYLDIGFSYTFGKLKEAPERDEEFGSRDDRPNVF